MRAASSRTRIMMRLGAAAGASSAAAEESCGKGEAHVSDHR